MKTMTEISTTSESKSKSKSKSSDETVLAQVVSQSTDNSNNNSSNNPHSLRIACLEPSATAICVALGLKDFLVGVTHECPETLTTQATTSSSSSNNDDDHDQAKKQTIHVLTANGLSDDVCASQGAIHEAVQDASTKAMMTCSLSSSSLYSSPIPSLYPLQPQKMELANPNVIFTQNLCGVCAPTEKDVQHLLKEQQQQQQQDSQNVQNRPAVVSLQPNTLEEVAETFVTVATACGVPERGMELQTTWLQNFRTLQQTIETHRDKTKARRPSVLILEWLDPPFDGGHWNYQMMEYACVRNAMGPKPEVKAKAQTWDRIKQSDPDIVLVGCCGFDLKRNVRDVQVHATALQQNVPRAVQTRQVYACDGNIYIAQPAPDLLQGTTILALCAYHDQPQVINAIRALGFLDSTDESKAWQEVDVGKAAAEAKAEADAKNTDATVNVADMEDFFISGYTETPSKNAASGFSQVHQEAVDKSQTTYVDPETGYQVFTSLAHTERGWCCGSGCRHCPYNHQNVKDKAQKIQQPSILYQPEYNCDGDDSDPSLLLFHPQYHAKTKVLFFSGGKDSFLTIRALVRQYYAQRDDPTKNDDSESDMRNDGFGLVLATTFDAASRKIAHQDVMIEDVIRQAKHLKITLLGIPLRRGSGEPYLERIERGLRTIEAMSDGKNNQTTMISSLVFGDLHLDHIKEWRDTTFGRSVEYQHCDLEYPLWKVPYPTLFQDLQTSRVPCILSAMTVKGEEYADIHVGSVFNKSLYEQAVLKGIDGFGEKGEFHSLAQVWKVPRNVALGIP